MRGIRGFSLTLLFAVLAAPHSACGINGGGTGKRNVAVLQVDQLNAALGLFHHDVGRYPTTHEGLRALVEDPGVDGWSGPYIDKKRIPPDPWGRPYRYRCPGEHDDYDLWSYGADGQPGGEGTDADVASWSEQF